MIEVNPDCNKVVQEGATRVRKISKVKSENTADDGIEEFIKLKKTNDQKPIATVYGR